MAQYTPVTLAYVTYDPVGGADETLSPIIFLHGATGSKEMWCDVAQSIVDKTRRKGYAIDARNHGDTEWTDEFNFDMNADDLFNFMNTLHIPQAVLIGHSMGGITSIRAALDSPDRVDMVLVEDMHVKKIEQEIMNNLLGFGKLMGEALKTISPDCPEEDVPIAMFKFISEQVPEEARKLLDPAFTKKVKLPLTKDADGRYVYKSNVNVIMKAMSNTDTLMSEPKGVYKGPSFFIYGTISPFKVYEDEDNIKKFFPNAEMIPIEKANHTIHFEYPEEFIDLVVKRILKH